MLMYLLICILYITFRVPTAQTDPTLVHPAESADDISVLDAVSRAKSRAEKAVNKGGIVVRNRQTGRLGRVRLTHLLLTHIPIARIFVVQIVWRTEFLQDLVKLITGILSIDVTMLTSLVQVECSVDLRPWSSWLVAASVAPTLCLVFGLWLAFGKCQKFTANLSRTIQASAVYLLLVGLYMPALSHLGQLLQCEDGEQGATDKLTLTGNCPIDYPEEYLVYYIIVAVSFALYGSAQIWLFIRLRRDSQWRQHVLGWAIEDYRSSASYWEAVIALFKWIVCAFHTFLKYPALPQLITMVLLLIAQCWIRPYNAVTENGLGLWFIVLEIAGVVCTIPQFEAAWEALQIVHNSLFVLTLIIIAIIAGRSLWHSKLFESEPAERDNEYSMRERRWLLVFSIIIGTPVCVLYSIVKCPEYVLTNLFGDSACGFLILRPLYWILYFITLMLETSPVGRAVSETLYLHNCLHDSTHYRELLLGER